MAINAEPALSPHLSPRCLGDRLLIAAFDAVELGRVPGPDGNRSTPHRYAYQRLYGDARTTSRSGGKSTPTRAEHRSPFI